MFVLTEESIEQESVEILKEHGLDIITQVHPKGSRKKIDSVISINDSTIILEFKLGKFKKIHEGIAQANEYKELTNADGIVSILFPTNLRVQVDSAITLRKLIKKTRIEYICLTPFLNDFSGELTIIEFAKKLIEASKSKYLQLSVQSVVKTLADSVDALAILFRKEAGIDNPVIDEVVGNFAMFKAIASSEEEDEKELALIAGSELASYILVNQILLYRLLSKPLKLTPLDKINTIPELNERFQEIKAINYKPIYSIDVISKVPRHIGRKLVRELNLIIKAQHALKPEEISHDILGRVFHEFLPRPIRKSLGAFYTKPIGAEILANALIAKPEGKVIDPSCGSGTLLVAAYLRKRQLGRRHKTIVENDLTGLDLMPFAAHLSAMNLTMMSDALDIDKTRIGVGDSLSISPDKKVCQFSYNVKLPYFTDGKKPTQTGLEDYKVVSQRKTVQLTDMPYDFQIGMHDYVIMNPPFTRKRNVTEQMWKTVELKELDRKIGKQNYWTYFLLLADKLLNKSGKIGAILPKDLFQGTFTRRIREWLFKNSYRFEIIIRTDKDIAFSEGARFRDYAVILSREHERTGKTKYVRILKSLDEITFSEAQKIGIKIGQKKPGYSDSSISISDFEAETVDELEKILGSSDEERRGFFEETVSEIFDIAGEKLTKIGSRNALNGRGIDPYRAKHFDIGWIVEKDPTGQRRGKISFEKKRQNNIQAIFENKEIHIPKYAIEKGIKTNAFSNKIDVTDINDYFIKAAFPKYDDICRKVDFEIFRLRDFKNIQKAVRRKRANLVFNRRFDITSPGTKLLCYYSDKQMIPSQIFWILKLHHEDAKIQTLLLNSVIGIICVLTKRSETRGSFSNILKKHIQQYPLFNMNKLGARDLNKLTKLYESISKKTFSSLYDQMKNPSRDRQKLDETVLSALGFSKERINEILPQIYYNIYLEFDSLKTEITEQ